MDNLTHTLVGLAAAKAGLERLSPAATAACVVAANAPDADILSLLGGRWFYLQHHRGITHSIIGTLALALLIPSVFFLIDRLIARIKGRPPRVKFRGLLLATLIVCATHPLMDWTNNYGVRPLLPWSARWYYGDLVFIIDPWLWLCFGGAAFLLTAKSRWRTACWTMLAILITAIVLFGPLSRSGLLDPTLFRAGWVVVLIGLAVAHRMRVARRYGSGIALIAFALVIIYWGGLAVMHGIAFARAQRVADSLAAQRGEKTAGLAAMPTLADPLHWQGVAETNRATYRFELFLNNRNTEEAVSRASRYEKPEDACAAAVARVSQDERTKIFLGFARFPAVRVQPDCLGQTLVQFADLRYTEPGDSPRGNFTLEIPITHAPEATYRETK